MSDKDNKKIKNSGLISDRYIEKSKEDLENYIEHELKNKKEKNNKNFSNIKFNYNMILSKNETIKVIDSFIF